MKVFLMGVFAVSLYASQAALACSCAPIDYNVDSKLKNSEAALIGIPTAQKTLPQSDLPMGPWYETTFKVVSQFTGKKTREIQIVHTKIGAACGLDFDLQGPTSYLIFAYEGKQGVSTNLCSAGAILPASPVNSALSKIVDILD